MGVENAEFLARLTNPQARAVMADYVTQTNVTGDLPLYQPTDHDKARAEGWYRSAVPRHRGRPGERRAVFARRPTPNNRSPVGDSVNEIWLALGRAR